MLKRTAHELIVQERIDPRTGILAPADRTPEKLVTDNPYPGGAMIVIRSGPQIDHALDRATANTNDGESDYPGMTYEDGLIAMHGWLTDPGIDHPFEEDIYRGDSKEDL